MKPDVLSEMHKFAGLTPQDDLSSFVTARRTRAETEIHEDVLTGMAGWLKGLEKAIATWHDKATKAKMHDDIFKAFSALDQAVLRLQAAVEQGTS